MVGANNDIRYALAFFQIEMMSYSTKLGVHEETSWSDPFTRKLDK